MATRREYLSSSDRGSLSRTIVGRSQTRVGSCKVGGKLIVWRRFGLEAGNCSLFFVRRRTVADVQLTPEQEAEAQRLAALIGAKVQEEALAMARLLVSKQDS